VRREAIPGTLPLMGAKHWRKLTPFSARWRRVGASGSVEFGPVKSARRESLAMTRTLGRAGAGGGAGVGESSGRGEEASWRAPREVATRAEAVAALVPSLHEGRMRRRARTRYHEALKAAAVMGRARRRKGRVRLRSQSGASCWREKYQ
jgi:hypothetical protein